MRELIKNSGFLIGCVASLATIIYAEFKFNAFKHKFFDKYNNKNV